MDGGNLKKINYPGNRKSRARPLAWEVGENGCYIVTSHKPNKLGYIELNVGGRRIHAHRLVWEQENGPLPDGLVVRHDCDTPSCINLAHLRLGTQGDNMRDMADRGRARNGQRRLKEAEALAILWSPEPGSVLAKRYGVSDATICDIRKRRSWRRLPCPPA